MSQESAQIFLDKMRQRFSSSPEQITGENLQKAYFNAYHDAARASIEARKEAAHQATDKLRRYLKDIEAYSRARLNHTSSPEQLRMNTAIGAGIGGLAGAGLGYLAGDGAGALIGGLGGTALGGYSGYNINNIRAALGLL